jgi:putative salt-induced outer membrane protein YdiY
MGDRDMNAFTKRLACAWAVILVAAAAVAADAPKRPWTDVADFGLVMTSGNANGTNFALANKFKYAWSNAELTFDAAALHAESTTRDITNPAPYGTAVVTDTTATTASSYGLALMYRRNIAKRFYWFAGASWFQNFFAGIDDRYIAAGGVGYTFVKNARNLLKGELGLDFTRQDPLGDPPPSELETTDFLGMRVYLGYEFKISERAKLTEDLNLFGNFDTTSAWRANSVTAVTAGFTDNLALKVSYTVMYSNDPPVKLVAPDTVPAPPPAAEDALYTFEKTDTILAVALVVNF